MKKLFTFKKLSWKISFIVFMAALIVGLPLGIYMQIRIINWVDQYSNRWAI